MSRYHIDQISVHTYFYLLLYFSTHQVLFCFWERGRGTRCVLTMVCICSVMLVPGIVSMSLALLICRCVVELLTFAVLLSPCGARRSSLSSSPRQRHVFLLPLIAVLGREVASDYFFCGMLVIAVLGGSGGDFDHMVD